MHANLYGDTYITKATMFCFKPALWSWEMLHQKSDNISNINIKIWNHPGSRFLTEQCFECALWKLAQLYPKHDHADQTRPHHQKINTSSFAYWEIEKQPNRRYTEYTKEITQHSNQKMCTRQKAFYQQGQRTRRAEITPREGKQCNNCDVQGLNSE